MGIVENWVHPEKGRVLQGHASHARHTHNNVALLLNRALCSKEKYAASSRRRLRERATPAPAAESVTETAPRSMQSPRPAPLGAAPRPGLLAGKELSLFPPVRHASQAEASPWPERRTPLAFFDPRSPSSRLPLTGNPYDHATDDLRPALDDNRCARVWVRMQIGVQPKCPKTQEPVPSQPRRSGSNQRRFQPEAAPTHQPTARRRFQPTSPPRREAAPTHTSPHHTERRPQPTSPHHTRRGRSNARTHQQVRPRGAVGGQAGGGAPPPPPR